MDMNEEMTLKVLMGKALGTAASLPAENRTGVIGVFVRFGSTWAAVVQMKFYESFTGDTLPFFGVLGGGPCKRPAMGRVIIL